MIWYDLKVLAMKTHDRDIRIPHVTKNSFLVETRRVSEPSNPTDRRKLSSVPETVSICFVAWLAGRAGKTGISHTFFTDDNKGLAGQLVNVLNEAKQPVPEAIKAYVCRERDC